MKICRGRTRIAIVTRKVTILFPRLRPYPSIENRELHHPIQRGINKNRVEARTSQALREISVPTHFSFFGIFNVRATAQAHSLTGYTIIDAIAARIGEETLEGSSHAWTNNNFGIHNGRLKFSDYGNAEANRIMQAHQSVIRTVLDSLIPPT
ncbi:hypothetical protein ACFL5U_02095 [Candidatus Margulisiibacteriota bacterium]